MDKSYLLSFPMVVHSLEVNKDSFHPKEENEELFSSEIPYLNAIDALLYLANCTRLDTTFSVNLLARCNYGLNRRHLNEIKHILQYLHETSGMGLYYSKESKSQLIGCVDAKYLSDSHIARSQMGYVFTYGGMTIAWRPVKQTMVATSSNHS